MIRKAELNDLPTLAELSCKLWPHHTVAEMLTEYGMSMANPNAAFFLRAQRKLPLALPNANFAMTM